MSNGQQPLWSMWPNGPVVLSSQHTTRDTICTYLTRGNHNLNIIRFCTVWHSTHCSVLHCTVLVFSSNPTYCWRQPDEEKSRIRETKHLSTDADSSTDAIGGWTKAKSAKKNFFLRGGFRPLPNKNVLMLDHCFPLLFPKDSESLTILDIKLREVGEKRPLNGTSKVKKVREKKTFFCAVIFDNFQTKMFISETTICHYFSPRIPNL